MKNKPIKRLIIVVLMGALISLANIFSVEAVELNTVTLEGTEVISTEKKITATGTSESGVLYQFWVKDLSTNLWSMIQDYSENNTARWTPTKLGSYLYGVHIKDRESRERLDAYEYKEISIRLPKPAVLDTVTLEGTEVISAEKKITATGTSESGVLYQFWVKDLSTNLWSMIQDYSENNTARWTPTKLGSYLYGVHIKDRESRERLDAYEYKEITIRLPKPAVLDTVTLEGTEVISTEKKITATGTSESGVLYQFWVKDLSTNLWSMIQDYSENNTARWTPTKLGSYLYGVHIKDRESRERLDAYEYKEISIRLPKPAVLDTVTLEGTEVISAEKKITATGTSESGVLYQFWVKDLSTNLWSMIQDYSENNTARWTPTKLGSYLYGVHIKDRESRERLDAYEYKEITIRLPKPAVLDTVTLEGTEVISAEKKITATGTSESGVLYQFWVKDLSTNLWSMIQDYSENNTARWTPTKLGSYLYGVHIKDRESRERLDAYEYKEITIRLPKPAVLDTVTLEGTEVISTEKKITATGTSESGVLYQFWVKDLSTNLWSMIQDYSENNTARWTPTKLGSYLYGVHIKDRESRERLDAYEYKEITIRLPKPAVLDTVTLEGTEVISTEKKITATGTSESGVLYQFWVKDLSTNLWSIIQDYSENNTARWTPTKLGSYLYGVHIKDRESRERLDAYEYKEITIRLPKPAVLKTLNISGSDTNSTLKTIIAKGESESVALYQFWVKDLSTNLWSMIQDYSSINRATWIPKTSGKYLYGVHIKSYGSESSYDDYTYNNFEVFGDFVFRYSHYNVSLESSVDRQMEKNPVYYSNSNNQSLATREQVEYYVDPTNFIQFDYIENSVLNGKAQINTSVLNVRSGPSTEYSRVGTVTKNEKFNIIDVNDGWYKIMVESNYGWINSAYTIFQSEKINVPIVSMDMYQFIVLSGRSGISKDQLEGELRGNGILEGKETAFLEASIQSNINELYLISHARLETGYGTSKLATGVLVSSVGGKAVEPKVVYNMFGIGAYDGNAVQAGSEYAYTQGWFSPETAIIEGAQWIGRGYINSKEYAQDTLYKMRWNPADPSHYHQYATDVGWAFKQNSLLDSLIQTSSKYNLTIEFDIPVYK